MSRLLGTTRATINTKRQNRQLLGLEGATRGFRFPILADRRGRKAIRGPADALRAPWQQPFGLLTVSSSRAIRNSMARRAATRFEWARTADVIEAAESVAETFA